mgnify:CR=1 FL=1
MQKDSAIKETEAEKDKIIWSDILKPCPKCKNPIFKDNQNIIFTGFVSGDILNEIYSNSYIT